MSLTSMFIRDFAIVRRLELELQSGFTVLTGETGAGKSILIDALVLALGGRGEADAIRAGADSAEVLAGFQVVDAHDATNWLKENELGEDECIVRRLVYRNKPTKAYINGRPVTVQMLRDLGEKLVDIHGQHEHQSLVRRDAQRAILDEYAGIGESVREIGRIFRELRQTESRLQAVTRESGDRTARIDLLRYQIDELHKLAPGDGEYRELEQEHARLAHASDLIEGLRSVADQLYDAEDNALSDRLGNCVNTLEALVTFDPALTEIGTLLNDALINIEEAAAAVRRRLDNVELDPQRLEWVQRRIGVFLDFARKHRCQPDELPPALSALEQELSDIDNAEENVGALTRHRDALRRDYDKQASVLHRARSDTAKRLARAVTEEMQGLGLTGGEFSISVDTESSEPTAHGYDRIEFLVSANPGQPLKPLARVASGGELSRISLAVQVIAAGKGSVPTLIFDEVDAGIGGGTAEIVGLKLRALGAARQVLCVTHLPQVASQGNHHLLVEKQSDDGVFATARPLDAKQRVQEIARMLGGVRITRQTLAHAEDMLERVTN